jgi:hypothetical protein
MTAFRATFSDLKLVKTRKVAQLIFEIPIEQFDAAYEVLGGMPVAAEERWFGIAALDVAKVEKPKRTWEELQPQQQAGMRCSEPTFIEFLKRTRASEWNAATDAADCVRMICGVNSRVELGTNQKARVIWTQLDSAYKAWAHL